MTRSFWRIPRAARLTTDEDGNQVPAFHDIVIYDANRQFYFCLSAQEERQDLVDAGATHLGVSTRALDAQNKARFFRVEVERLEEIEGTTQKVRHLLKASEKRADDTEIRADLPAVMWLGDDPEDYAP